MTAAAVEPVIQPAPREHGILFSAPMVRAILAGRKTQTRRLYKPRYPSPYEEIEDGVPFQSDEYGEYHRRAEPYGVPGDRLWVRETWATDEDYDDFKPSALNEDDTVIYHADGTHRGAPARPGKTRVSIHMPRWASRINLEVTGVRVERVGDLTEEDAKAEGMLFHDGRGIGHTGWRHDPGYGFVEGTPRGAFFALWRLIHGDNSLKANPWCWAVAFKVVSQ